MLFDEYIAAQIVQQIIHTWLVAGECVIIIETVHLYFSQIELVASEHSLWIDILWQFFGCFYVQLSNELDN